MYLISTLAHRCDYYLVGSKLFPQTLRQRSRELLSAERRVIGYFLEASLLPEKLPLFTTIHLMQQTEIIQKGKLVSEKNILS